MFKLSSAFILKLTLVSIVLISSLSFRFEDGDSSKEFILYVVFNQGFTDAEPVTIDLTNNHVQDKRILSEKLAREAGELGTNIFEFSLPKNEYNNLVIEFTNRSKTINQTFYVSKLDTLYFEMNVTRQNEFYNIIFDKMVGYYD